MNLWKEPAQKGRSQEDADEDLADEGGMAVAAQDFTEAGGPDRAVEVLEAGK